MSSFAEFALLPSLLEALAEQGLTRPTEIQSKTIPALLAHENLVGVAETGSGKTLAYALPMLDRLKRLETEDEPVATAGRPRGMVLVPGRELGEQVGKVFKSLTHGTRLRVRSVLGGTQKQIARQNVSGSFDIVVATPGRLQQLLISGDLQLDDLRMFVCDEADQLLDPGFLPVLRRIVARCRAGVQLVMFAATLPQLLESVVDDVFGRKPLRVRTRGSQRVVRTLTTDNRIVRGPRAEVLREVFGKDRRTGTLLFANTRAQCDVLAAWLDGEGIGYVRYTGQMDRIERRRNLERFRRGEVAVLLTTDLGGRGLDIERVERVVNAHLPADIDNYLNRVGRTARAGRTGLVVNLVTQRDEPLLAKLKKRELSRG